MCDDVYPPSSCLRAQVHGPKNHLRCMYCHPKHVVSYHNETQRSRGSCDHTVFRSGTSLCDTWHPRVGEVGWAPPEEIAEKQRASLDTPTTAANTARSPSVCTYLPRSVGLTLLATTLKRGAKGPGHFHPTFSTNADLVLVCHVIG